MRPASDEFLAAVATNHDPATRVTLLEDGVETGTTFDTVTDGTVTLDAAAATRGRCDLTVIDDGSLGLVPDDPAADLAPYGNEVKVERGVTFTDGTTELISLGIFRLQRVDVSDVGDELAIRITGLDRSAKAIDARFEAVYTIATGATITSAIQTMLSLVDPAWTYSFAASSKTTNAAFGEEGGDRWAFAQSLATALGMELYFDGDGVCVLRPTSQGASGSAVADLVEGDGGVLVSAARSWDREGTYNRVIATGEAPADGVTAPVRGVATDDNPLSPTYYYGPYGKVPRFYTSEFLTTSDQATDAAAGILAKELGTTQKVDFGSIVNPALEPGDVVQITRERTGIDEEHVIDNLTIPLAASEGMSGSTRAVVVQ